MTKKEHNERLSRLGYPYTDDQLWQIGELQSYDLNWDDMPKPGHEREYFEKRK